MTTVYVDTIKLSVAVFGFIIKLVLHLAMIIRIDALSQFLVLWFVLYWLLTDRYRVSGAWIMKPRLRSTVFVIARSVSGLASFEVHIGLRVPFVQYHP